MGFLSDVVNFYNLEDTNEELKERLEEKFVKELNKKSKVSYSKQDRYMTFKIRSGITEDAKASSLFSKYKSIPFKVCKTLTKMDDISSSLDFIRIKINTLYGVHFDKEVYYDKEYYNLLLTPRREYFKARENISNLNYEEIENRIISDLKKAEKIKQKCIANKGDLSWQEYKKFINKCLIKIMRNCKTIEQLKDDEVWKEEILVNGWSFDNVYVRYFCRCLDGYVKSLYHELKGTYKGKKWKSGINKYLDYENVDISNTLAILLGKFITNNKQLKAISMNKINKLTYNQMQFVKKVEKILPLYNKKEIILFNDCGYPRINEGILAREVGIARSSLVDTLLGIYNNIMKEPQIVHCLECWKLIKKKNNKTKYCKECAKKIKNEQNKKYYHLGK